MDILMDILSLVLKLFAVYTALVGAFFLLPRRRFPIAPPKARFAVLLPARNEEAVIGDSVRSLLRQDYPRELFDVYVLPNNCTDRTEEAARKAGARIFRCRGPVRSKGEVLHQAFAHLMGKYDAYCVFDADNLVAPGFLARMNDAYAAGAQAAKGRIVASNPYDNWVAGCYELHFSNANLLYSRPRERLGLSGKLVGTGFMVTDQLLQRLGGWNTRSLAEDAEFAAICAKNGVRVRYVPDAVHYDEEPTSFAASLRQRRRWSAGLQDVARRYIPSLLKTWGPLQWDFAVFLSRIYLQLLALLPVCWGLIHMEPLAALAALGIGLAGFWAGATATALFLCVAAGRSPRRMWKTIALYPIFVASWYPLHIISLVSAPKAWHPMTHIGAGQRAA